MRLSGILSKPPNDEFKQIEGFLEGKKLKTGQQKKIIVGQVALPFFCDNCRDNYIFFSEEKLFCIGVNDNTVSIDCIISCPQCNSSSVPAWFLVVCDEDISSRNPNAKILKRSFKLSDNVFLSEDRFDGFTEMLNKARLAHAEELGAGSVIYLRKILEIIPYQAAEVAGIETKRSNSKRKPFRHILEEVDRVQAIIPREFSENGYKLFGELSNVIHGDSDEQLALQKYHALRRLVIGIIENVKNNQEIMAAINILGWNGEGESR